MLLVGLAAIAAGQRTTTLDVTVADSAGQPLGSVEVKIPSLNRGGRSDMDGHYTFVDLPSGQFQIVARRLGYSPQTVSVRTGTVAMDSLHITMPEIIVELQGVRISAAQHPFVQEYERRRAKGIGTFITPKDIQKLKPSYSSEIFRQLPMVRLINTPSGYGIRFQAMLSIDQKREECIPIIWVDGQRVPGMEIDEIGANDIFAVEVYRGASTVPTEFITNGRTQCGVIVVWTKRNGATFKRPP